MLIQIIIALAIVNVWLFRFNKATEWRGGNAKSMKEEFKIYGLPSWFVAFIGSLKLIFAAMLVAGIWIPSLKQPAAIGIAILMLGAISMHFKVNDPLLKSLPALTLLLLSLTVAFI